MAVEVEEERHRGGNPKRRVAEPKAKGEARGDEATKRREGGEEKGKKQETLKQEAKVKKEATR